VETARISLVRPPGAECERLPCLLFTSISGRAERVQAEWERGVFVEARGGLLSLNEDVVGHANLHANACGEEGMPCQGREGAEAEKWLVSLRAQ
jgi:hypothetical protein